MQGDAEPAEDADGTAEAEGRELDLWASLMLRWMAGLPDPAPGSPPGEPPEPPQPGGSDWWLAG